MIENRCPGGALIVYDEAVDGEPLTVVLAIHPEDSNPYCKLDVDEPPTDGPDVPYQSKTRTRSGRDGAHGRTRRGTRPVPVFRVGGEPWSERWVNQLHQGGRLGHRTDDPHYRYWEVNSLVRAGFDTLTCRHDNSKNEPNRFNTRPITRQYFLSVRLPNSSVVVTDVTGIPPVSPWVRSHDRSGKAYE